MKQYDNLRFASDVMLGRLAKWLRIFGYDTFYKNDVSYFDLIKISLTDGRILLTRNTEFLRKKYLNKLFITSNMLSGQLNQVINEFFLKEFKLFSRCVYCNDLLVRVDKIKVKDSVPLYVFETQEYFYQCRLCLRYYWQGTHAKLVKEYIGINLAA